MFYGYVSRRHIANTFIPAVLCYTQDISIQHYEYGVYFILNFENHENSKTYLPQNFSTTFVASMAMELGW